MSLCRGRFAAHTATSLPRNAYRKWAATAAATAACAAVALSGTGIANAASVQDLKTTIESGLRTPAADVILDGDSTWSIPTVAGPEKTAFLRAFGNSLLNPNYAPPGSNDFSCKPKSGQNPVVLVHGTWENAYDNWANLSPLLKRTGFCVFALDYGKLDVKSGGGVGKLLPGALGTGDIAQSADELSSFVDQVLAATGSTKVDIVGHSQGGLMARQYLKFNGGASKVSHLVTLGATNHGTTLDGIGSLGRTINNMGIDILGPVGLGVGVSGIQQVVGSSFLNTLNAGGDTVPGVNYTVIATKYDEVTTPYASTFLTAGSGATVKNLTVQDNCKSDLSDHLSMNYSFHVITMVLNALGAKWLGIPVPEMCSPNAWFFG